ncbi:acetyl-CoA carboxylase biotin carboxyl carrier protein [Sphaerisporangium album]|uniref:Biotin carboxyl carrier protein of acetyl-CoA carboxylase n=1 Tax=Sphaerisporangium album TaxID=509200 RepID=A0A367FJ41_9ACTN|nr:acetyl-CoA carboxylase biotin carboxyl carrier protein [Sphaerisporangium album]RCG30281.1 acetyl-CoA carboxylase biotin carboxyl carrier protein [Sphaerisporangium album]
MSEETVDVHEQSNGDGSNADVTLADLRHEVRQLISDVGRPIRRVSLRAGTAVIEVEWESSGAVTEAPAHAQAAAPQQYQAPATGSGPEPAAEPAADRHRIAAPLVGTFYSAPSPGAEPFVNVGDVVQPGRQVAIVEAMKLMNAVTADRAGTVVSVEVSDGEFVEFGQTLIVIEPADGSE